MILDRHIPASHTLKPCLVPRGSVVSYLFDFMLPGLVALGVIQFITFFFSDTANPGWLLGMADWLLYVYAVFVAFKAF